ncbi:hypothetical protein RIR_jg6970.t1 [Rhizophagus irregularis DAOM 181602=DAOM 197198]|nr:hypothetical protein RIR_jg6970.t1 [Rhizophagus irregularis DAOM 181602=DAOM 197198]
MTDESLLGELHIEQERKRLDNIWIIPTVKKNLIAYWVDQLGLNRQSGRNGRQNLMFKETSKNKASSTKDYVKSEEVINVVQKFLSTMLENISQAKVLNVLEAESNFYNKKDRKFEIETLGQGYERTETEGKNCKQVSDLVQ